MKQLIVLFISTFFFVSAMANGGEVLPNNPFLSYVGRFSHEKSESKCIYSGSSIFITFEAKDISVKFFEYGVGGDEHTNYILPILDGDTLNSIQLLAGTNKYEVSKSLTKGKHTLQLYKQTETHVGEIGFQGFFSRSGLIVYPYEGLSRNILAIGDSWTAAYGNKIAIEAPPKGQPNTGFHSKNQSHYESWSSITSRILEANLECVAISGRGMYRNSWNVTENTIPKVFDFYNPEVKEKQIVKSDFTPDVILIHLGTNDFIAEWLPESKSALDSSQFVSTYINFVNKMRLDYPKAKVVCIFGNSSTDYWPEGALTLTRFRAYINAVVNDFKIKDDKNVSLFELNTQQAPYGEDWHPTIKTHYQMANEITPYVKQIMSW